jgi:hypothetical protein
VGLSMDITAAVRLIFEIESGARKITPRRNPAEVYAGNVEYDVEGGWVLVVFIDGNTFDYIDSITAPDGTRWDLDLSFLGEYDPPAAVVRDIYGIIDR